MLLNDLSRKSILILGFGIEGQATYDFLREQWPSKPLSIADQRMAGEFSDELLGKLARDPAVRLNFGPSYLDSVDPDKCEVIIKTPGIPASIEQITKARKAGCVLTSHSQIFLSNYPRHKIIGVTGTKGKSTTTSLIHQMLRRAGLRAELAGNIGRPPLANAAGVSKETYFVHEFSSHQLAEIESSPHIAVLLNVVPEHLDYYSSFAEYVSAKENITRFQQPDDFLIFNADYPIPSAIAGRTRAALRPFSTKTLVAPGCHLEGENIVWSSPEGEDRVLTIRDIPLAGRFNVQNVMAAVAAASLCGVRPEPIRDAVKEFRALPHRLELVGSYDGVTFYDDSIATVPEATLAALDALGPDVQTLILGGHERNQDFAELGARLPASIGTVILFPSTGLRIWKAIEQHSKSTTLPKAFFVETMEEAVQIAYARTEQGRICLLSPASPSFGIFRDYRERGESFKTSIEKLAKAKSG